VLKGGDNIVIVAISRLVYELPNGITSVCPTPTLGDQCILFSLITQNKLADFCDCIMENTRTSWARFVYFLKFKERVFLRKLHRLNLEHTGSIGPATLHAAPMLDLCGLRFLVT